MDANVFSGNPGRQWEADARGPQEGPWRDRCGTFAQLIALTSGRISIGGTLCGALSGAGAVCRRSSGVRLVRVQGVQAPRTAHAHAPISDAWRCPPSSRPVAAEPQASGHAPPLSPPPSTTSTPPCEIPASPPQARLSQYPQPRPDCRRSAEGRSQAACYRHALLCQLLSAGPQASRPRTITSSAPFLSQTIPIDKWC